jgi:hypothetical protein
MITMIRSKFFIRKVFLFDEGAIAPNGWALSCGADDFQVADNETSSR